MNNHRELSIDELGTVSGGDLGGMASIIHVESVRLEGVRNTTASSTPTASPGAPQVSKSSLDVMNKINAAYAAGIR